MGIDGQNKNLEVIVELVYFSVCSCQEGYRQSWQSHLDFNVHTIVSACVYLCVAYHKKISSARNVNHIVLSNNTVVCFWLTISPLPQTEQFVNLVFVEISKWSGRCESDSSGSACLWAKMWFIWAISIVGLGQAPQILLPTPAKWFLFLYWSI